MGSGKSVASVELDGRHIFVDLSTFDLHQGQAALISRHDGSLALSKSVKNSYLDGMPARQGLEPSDETGATMRVCQILGVVLSTAEV